MATFLADLAAGGVVDAHRHAVLEVAVPLGADAQDADVLIYNSTIAGEIHSVDELVALSPLFADFKAVQEGNVWCMSADFFQNSMELGTAMEELHDMLLLTTGESEGEEEDRFTFLYKLD